ncbi:hypothetical protein N865_00625 [Intrasporangium oryzae NRRL B-24470]|uniref:DUF3068 domain-containing protein n=1 Tax=Intrasporangium oryzae NRRL B-24470 TaxID=1386089 RepID=W9GDS3_9MICO|nr:DUF3068 domain-containing protein [Intrasporangium oryzae]EWT02978.1 hypothetical protein N865_00625 [Intrasporangium oryzae NRRL B-24470]
MVLLFLGAFLLVSGLLARFWAPGQVMKTPLDVSSVMRLTGEAQLYDGTALVSTPVRASSVTHSDSARSDGDVVVFQNSSCLVKDPDGKAPDCVSADDPQNRLVSASTDTFATDRRTAEAVNDASYLPADAKPHQGLVNKFPFNVEKRDYMFWDGLVNKAVPATFAGEEDLDGVATYKFVVNVQDGAITIGTDPGTYSTEKTMWVDALTGSIVKQNEHQVRKMADSGQTVLDLTFGFTPETVAANIEDAKANASKLGLLTTTVPLVGLIGGVIALFAGFVLYRREGSESAAEAGADAAPRKAAAQA